MKRKKLFHHGINRVYFFTLTDGTEIVTYFNITELNDLLEDYQKRVNGSFDADKFIGEVNSRYPEYQVISNLGKRKRVKIRKDPREKINKIDLRLS